MNSKHLKDDEFDEHLQRTGSDGFTEACLLLLLLILTVVTVVLYVNSFWQAVILFLLEIVFEAGAIPAGVSVLIGPYDPKKSYNVYLLKIVAWSIFAFLLIVALLAVATQQCWPFYAVCLYLIAFTFFVVAWGVVME